MKPDTESSGVYYFLGNITSHILHALPLYEKLGGTIVVLSEKAKDEIAQYNVPVINIDDKPRQWTRFSRFFIKPVHEYLKIGPDLKKTTEFLNKNARVVLFYEPYDFDPKVRLSDTKTVFLTHGNMLKDYMNEARRLEIIKQYDYMAAIGPYLKQKFIASGIEPSKLVDLGIARTDLVVADKGAVNPPTDLLKRLGLSTDKPIVAYMPTFWGESSVYNLGKEIVANTPGDYTLIFRPHPQTPDKLLHDYQKIIEHRSNVLYAPEGTYTELGLLDIYRAASVFIGDVSSVMLEAILTEKPLVFAYDQGEHRQDGSIYEQIAGVVAQSASLTPENIDKLPTILAESVQKGTDTEIWQKTRNDIFFHADGTSVDAIVSFVRSLLQR